MKQVENIGNEGFQSHTIPLPTGDLILKLKFLSLVGFWQMSVEFNGKSINGIKLSVGVLHMRSANFPFDFIVQDTSESGIDPFKSDDFTLGRCILYLLESDEIAEIRGQEVE